ncbi:unnamed protein product [Haemonchus placei]|uniref:Protein kinase domain-containing protein n=1 Tax=Haemonchus placei TaxID=6290 RepID=A0A0N4W6Z6_HAEPC|nr:unnamed protein product [Haemonchus placei]
MGGLAKLHNTLSFPFISLGNSLVNDFEEVTAPHAVNLYAFSVKRKTFSSHHTTCQGLNVFSGTVLEPKPQREIAIKKTWPESKDRERNFEMIFLTGISRKKHKNIVQMIFAFSNRVGKDNKICESFVFDFLPDTLASVIKREVLDDTDIKIYTWQLFNGLRYLSMHQIVHRDIKPLNVLIDHPLALLKIGDFGSAKIVRSLRLSFQVTRFYRPPELLLGSEYYNWTVDLWSAGCVVGEMLRGNVLFPGRHGRHQLKLIFLCLGSPTDEDVKLMKVSLPFCISLPTKSDFNSFQLCPHADQGMLELLAKVLVYRPNDRLYGRQLLMHPAFASILKLILLSVSNSYYAFLKLNIAERERKDLTDS